MSYSKDRNFSLSGKVANQGLPVANVLVALFDLPPEPLSMCGIDAVIAKACEHAKTSAKGEFSFSVRSGIYALAVIPNAGTRFLNQTLSEVKVLGNTTVNIGLATGYVVEGTVVSPYSEQSDELLAKLFASIEVVALGIEPSSYCALSAVSQSGQFSMVLPKGRYNLALRSTSRDKDSASLKPAFNFVSTQSEVVDIVSDCQLSLNFSELTGFAGLVVDAFGEPVSAVVTMAPSISTQSGTGERENFLLSSELDMRSSTITAEDGRFQFAVEPGSYDVEISPLGNSLLFGHKETGLNIAEGSEERKFVLQEGHRLRGQVVFQDKLLSQSLIRLVSNERKQEYLVRTDEEGQFAVSLPGGSYKVIAVAHPKDASTMKIEGGQYSSLAPWTRNVVVGGDTHVAVRLSEGTALMGRISDDAGQARPGVKVSVFAEAPGKPVGSDSSPLVSGTTDGEGRYCLFLSPGQYLLVVHNDFENARQVELADEPCELDIVWHGWSQVRFELFGADGRAIGRCRVVYQPYGHDLDEEETQTNILRNSAVSYPHGYVMTQEDGGCRLTLPAGVYSFKFIPPQAGSYEPKTIRQLSISADIARRVTLDLKGNGKEN